jgi:hypothetical protein
LPSRCIDLEEKLMVRTWQAALALALGFYLAGRAKAKVTYHFDAVVSYSTIYDVESEGTEFVRGDVYHVQFSIDDSVTDHGSDEGIGNFNAAFTDFVMVVDAANVGTWDPSSTGSWALPHQIVTYSL